jgi:hypothetical protein
VKFFALSVVELDLLLKARAPAAVVADWSYASIAREMVVLPL